MTSTPTPEGAAMTDERLEAIRKLNARPSETCDVFTLGEYIDANRDLLNEVTRLRSLAAPGDEEVAEAINALLHPSHDDQELPPSAFDVGIADLLTRLSASYSAACGEREDARADARAANAALAPLDAVVHHLGIEDSFVEPVEAIKKIELERDRARADAAEWKVQHENLLAVKRHDLAQMDKLRKQAIKGAEVVISADHGYRRGLEIDLENAKTAISLALVERDRAREALGRMKPALRSCYDFIKAEYGSDEAIAQDGHPIERGRARFVWEVICKAYTEADAPIDDEGAAGITPRSHILSEPALTPAPIPAQEE